MRSIGSGHRSLFPEEESQLFEWIIEVHQNSLADLENQLLNFQQFVIRLYQKNDYPLEMIANMDETPVYFDIAGAMTVNTKGAKTVHVRITGNEKNRFTVVLICLANSRKLPLVIIFKGKIWPTNMLRPPAGNNSQPELHNSKVLLVFDSFLAHIMDQIKAALRSRNTDLAVIPEGLTRSEDHLIYNDDDESNDEEESDEDEEEESDEEPDEESEEEPGEEPNEEDKESDKDYKTGDENES
ncbi:5769_t:CDS:2, partial [Scutellospora calospora]